MRCGRYEYKHAEPQPPKRARFVGSGGTTEDSGSTGRPRVRERKTPRAIGLLPKVRRSNELHTPLGQTIYRSFPRDDLDLSGKIDHGLCDLYDMYDVAHAAGWEPYILYDLRVHVSWVGSVLQGRPLRNLSRRQVGNN